MDDTGSLGALLTIGVDMAHYVMADLFFPGLSHVVVDVLLMGPQFFQLFIGDGQAQFLLRLRQGDPQLAPGAELASEEKRCSISRLAYREERGD